MVEEGGNINKHAKKMEQINPQEGGDINKAHYFIPKKWPQRKLINYSLVAK